MEICVVNFSSYAQVLLWLKMNAISIFLEEKKKQKTFKSQMIGEVIGKIM